MMTSKNSAPMTAVGSVYRLVDPRRRGDQSTCRSASWVKPATRRPGLTQPTRRPTPTQPTRRPTPTQPTRRPTPTQPTRRPTPTQPTRPTPPVIRCNIGLSIYLYSSYNLRT